MSNAIKLYQRETKQLSLSDINDTRFFKVTTNVSLPRILQSKHALLVTEKSTDLSNLQFGAYLFLDSTCPEMVSHKNSFLLSNELDYLSSGDVIRITSNKNIRVIYRLNAKPNYLMVTEQCNSFCLMCSQPPKPIDDSFLYDEYLNAVPLFDRDTPELGITGGEPTIMRERFLKLLTRINAYLPRTAVHVLTNGKSFSDLTFVEEISAIRLNDLMFGIPLYSGIPRIHEYIVQDKDSFYKTVEGIMNLKRYNLRVEVRCVIQKPNHRDLITLAEYIARNLQFVDQVAFMGLEVTGFAKSNIEDIWVEPTDYIAELETAVQILSRARVQVKLYNHQLCLLPTTLHRYNVKSISDWKNTYIDECDKCSRKSECGGFFTTSNGKVPRLIKAFQ